jgi:hypothetical protein
MNGATREWTVTSRCSVSKPTEWLAMRSPDRVRELGEVFTPEKEVQDILDLFEDINYASRFLEPGCGSGNFLVEILKRKLQMVVRLPEVSSSLKTKNPSEFEFKSVIALGSIYGIDIDEVNILEAKERLFDDFKTFYKSSTKEDLPDYLEKVVLTILSRNIILGDMLQSAEKIEVFQYSELPMNKIKQRVFRFSDLIFPEDEVFEDNDMLFGHVPVQLRDLPAISYKEIGE